MLQLLPSVPLSVVSFGNTHFSYNTIIIKFSLICMQKWFLEVVKDSPSTERPLKYKQKEISVIYERFIMVVIKQYAMKINRSDISLSCSPMYKMTFRAKDTGKNCYNVSDIYPTWIGWKHPTQFNNGARVQKWCRGRQLVSMKISHHDVIVQA